MAMINSERPDSDHFSLHQFITGLLNKSYVESFPQLSMLHCFTKTEVLTPFLETVVPCGSTSISSFSNGVDILSEFIKKYKALSESTMNPSNYINEFCHLIVQYLDQLTAIFKSGSGLYQSPSGKIPIVGIPKLKVVKLFADLILFNSSEIISELMKLQAGEKILELFFMFPSNSFLQSNVCDFIGNLCLGEWQVNKEMIIKSIFYNGQLLKRITLAQKLADTLAEMPRGSRPSYMGHITILSDQVHILLDKHSAELYKEIGALLRTEEWIEYSNKSYRETKLKDASVLGGEPAPPMPTPMEDVFTSIFSSAADENVHSGIC
jgi:hypothetical protein